MVQADGYDPRKSKVSDDRMERWRVDKLTPNLLDVPGIGPATVKKLAEGADHEKITNTNQLFGKVSALLDGAEACVHTHTQSVSHGNSFACWFNPPKKRFLCTAYRRRSTHITASLVFAHLCSCYSDSF